MYSQKELYEERKKKRIEAREAQVKERKRSRLFSTLAIAIPGGVILSLFVYIFITSSAITAPEIGEFFSDQGREHIKEGASHPPYNSNPPTSGWHYDTPQDWGVYNESSGLKEEIAQERLIHNLEHGGIVIQFKPTLDPAIISKLEDLKNSEFECKLVVVPYTGLDTNIALTAWRRLYKSDVFEEETIKNFIKKYRNRAPEFVPCSRN